MGTTQNVRVLVHFGLERFWTETADGKVVEGGHEFAKEDVHQGQQRACGDHADEGHGIETPSQPVGVTKDSLSHPMSAKILENVVSGRGGHTR